MDLDLVFLGTGGSVPTARRATACLLARRGGDRLLFDCGEGAQRQMHGSVGLVQLDAIFLTHYHADHYLGLPGLLKTYDLQGREAPLRVHGPRGLGDLFKAIQRIVGRTKYPVELVELEPGEAVAADGYEVRSYSVEHRVPAYGYALVEAERPGRFDPEAATRLGVPEGPGWGALQRGQEVEGADGKVKPSDVLGEARPGRKLVLTGDSAVCEATRVAADGAELLVHDGSFADDEAERAKETAHATAREAARLAKEAGVAMLALVHVSSRYNVSAVLDEAREEFEATEAPRDFDLIDVPLPERGKPRLVRDGAHQRPEQPPDQSPGG